MKLYYQNNLVTLYHGNCKEFELNKADLVVTDPPFNIGYKYDLHGDRMNDGEYLELLRLVCRPPSVVILYPETQFLYALHIHQIPSECVSWVYSSNQPRQHRMIAWWGAKPDFKLDGQPYKNPTDKRIKPFVEAGKQARIYDWWEIQQVKNVSKEKVDHPCQMPLAVMTRILKITPGYDRIVEPFAGAGSTLVAAMNLGIKSTGIELSEKYCEIIAKRIEDEERKLH